MSEVVTVMEKVCPDCHHTIVGRLTHQQKTALTFYGYYSSFKVLPYAGGIVDQPLGLLERMTEIDTVIQTITREESDARENEQRRRDHPKTY